jgi:hypothetical protein
MKITRKQLADAGASEFITIPRIFGDSQELDLDVEENYMKFVQMINAYWKGMPDADQGIAYKETGNYTQIKILTKALFDAGRRYCSDDKGNPLFPGGIALERGYLGR